MSDRVVASEYGKMLYSIAGDTLSDSSVFPNVGHQNPTLTLLALTLRLAEHIGARP